jgi:hypothetical protein
MLKPEIGKIYRLKENTVYINLMLYEFDILSNWYSPINRKIPAMPGMCFKVIDYAKVHSDKFFLDAYITKLIDSEDLVCFTYFPISDFEEAVGLKLEERQEIKCNLCRKFSLLGGFCTSRYIGASKECFEPV